MAFFISTNTNFSGVFLFIFYFLQSLPVILMCSSFHVKLKCFFNDSVLDCLVVMIVNILIIIIITS